jgi:predicted TIM-barrel fold metal-dependent hydrolase
MVAELGPERVVFGSNAPYLDQGFEVARVRLSHLEAAAKTAMASENALRIFAASPASA